MEEKTGLLLFATPALLPSNLQFEWVRLKFGTWGGHGQAFCTVLLRELHAAYKGEAESDPVEPGVLKFFMGMHLAASLGGVSARCSIESGAPGTAKTTESVCKKADNIVALGGNVFIASPTVVAREQVGSCLLRPERSKEQRAIYSSAVLI